MPALQAVLALLAVLALMAVLALVAVLQFAGFSGWGLIGETCFPKQVLRDVC